MPTVKIDLYVGKDEPIQDAVKHITRGTRVTGQPTGYQVGGNPCPGCGARASTEVELSGTWPELVVTLAQYVGINQNDLNMLGMLVTEIKDDAVDPEMATTLRGE